MPTDNSRPMRVTVVDPPAYTPPYDHCAVRGARAPRARGRARHEPVPARAGPAARRLPPRGELLPPRGARARSRRGCSTRSTCSRLASRLRAPAPRRRALPVAAGAGRWTALLVRAIPATARDHGARHPAARGERAPRGARGALLARSTRSSCTRRPAASGWSRSWAAAGARARDPARSVRATSRGDDGRRTGPGASATSTAARSCSFFGLVRPYKGVDVLIEAFAATPADAVLLVVGMPRYAARAAASGARASSASPTGCASCRGS